MKTIDQEKISDLLGQDRSNEQERERISEEISVYFPRSADELPGIETERPEDYLRDDGTTEE